MKTPSGFSVRLAALCTVALLGACGGSGDDTGTETTPGGPATPNGVVPPSAYASIMAFFNYTGSLGASETDMPLDVTAVTPPVSETAAPSPVN